MGSLRPWNVFAKTMYGASAQGACSEHFLEPHCDSCLWGGSEPTGISFWDEHISVRRSGCLLCPSVAFCSGIIDFTPEATNNRTVVFFSEIQMRCVKVFTLRTGENLQLCTCLNEGSI